MIGLSSLFVYFRDNMQVEQPLLYFGIAHGIICISSSVSSIVFGRIVDRTRKAKLIICIGLICGVLGGLVYAIYFSPVFPLLGRVLGGIQMSFPSIATGELIRMHNKEDGVRSQWWLATTFSMGIVIGPAFNIFFKDIYVEWGFIKINPNNVVGLFVAFLCSFALSLAIMFIKDCPIHPCHILNKHHIAQRNEPDQVSEPSSTDESSKQKNIEDNDSFAALDGFQTPSMTEILIKFLNSPYMWLMMLSTLHFAFCAMSFDILISVINYELFHWTVESLTTIYTSYSILYCLIMMCMSRYCLTFNRIYAATLICIVCLLLNCVVVFCMKKYAITNNERIACVVLFVVTYSTVWILDEVLMRVITAKLVPTIIQSQTEAARSSVTRLAFFIASLSTPIIFQYLAIIAFIMGSITFILLLVYLYSWRFLCNVSVIDFSKRC